MTEWSRETVEQIDAAVARLNRASDTKEQTMAMTITQEQFETAYSTFMDTNAEWKPSMKVALESLGITITPAEPPAEMVKLARDAWTNLPQAVTGNPNDAWRAGYLAALQHAAEKARQATDSTIMGDMHMLRTPFLASIGAGGRDAG